VELADRRQRQQHVPLVMLRLGAVVVAALALAAAAAARTSDTAPVAYVGCSVSEMSVLGYHSVGGVRMWPSNGKYDSGLVSTWAGSLTSRWWQAFDAMNVQHPGADQVWWELCVQTGQTMVQLDADAQIVLARIHARMPGVPVYVSSLAPYPDHLCATTGLDGIANGQAEADALVASGDALAGPVMAPLDNAHVYAGSTCHPNVKGQKLEGQILLGFFG
jgi:hypothetical protein